MTTTGKTLREALKLVGANNIFRAEIWTIDPKWNNRVRDKKKASGMNWWIADGFLTFEGIDGKTADVELPGADYQVCGFLDRAALTGIRQIRGKVQITVDDGHLVFTERTERMRLRSRYRILAPASAETWRSVILLEKE